ncbi:MAG TPA: hypothetical protein VLM38_09095 [Blastocatellia bacterium]|nr:hypothetical protein [Blastocatellia bacterium]
METVITRDTDVLREYLAALDTGARGLSPFQKLAATVKLARLRGELSGVQLESTDEDFAALRHEVDERLNRSLLRRFQANAWGARISIFVMLVAGQQLALAVMLSVTMLFVRFARVPKLWNPLLPHEQPAFLFAFIFLFFFATPMLALSVVFGGRFYRAWRITLPATLLIVVVSALLTFLAVRSKEGNNPVRHTTSLGQFMKEREVNAASYNEWLQTNWLMKDAKFQRDYERYLRNGPGRWITSRFDSRSDAAWRDSIPILNEYLDAGQDPGGFRDWLKYYFDRNRIYSEDRIDQEVSRLTDSANERFLGVWLVEPYLRERDQRLYRAYLGSIDESMKAWGLAWLGLLSVVFLGAYVTTFVAPYLRRRMRGATPEGAVDNPQQGSASSWVGALNSFPERSEITTPPFFDEPFKLLSRVHRGFLRLAVFASVLVFVFWAAVYALDLSSERVNPPSQISFMRSNLLFGGTPERPASDAGENNGRTENTLSGASREAALVARVSTLENQLDEDDYHSNRRFKEQYRIIASQRNELSMLRSATGQLEQTLPGQLSDIGSRVGVAEARTGEVMGQAEAARQTAEGLQKQLGAKLSEVETRATRAADQIGKVEEQASVLATRTETLERELDRRARQIEARTEELGERTAGLKEREERVDRLQRVAFTAIFAEIKSDVDELDRRIGSSFYRFFSKGEARRDADAIRQRISSLAAELRDINTDQSKKFIEQLDELSKHLDQIAERIK